MQTCSLWYHAIPSEVYCRALCERNQTACVATCGCCQLGKIEQTLLVIIVLVQIGELRLQVMKTKILFSKNASLNWWWFICRKRAAPTRRFRREQVIRLLPHDCLESWLRTLWVRGGLGYLELEIFVPRAHIPLEHVTWAASAKMHAKGHCPSRLAQVFRTELESEQQRCLLS